MRSRLAPALITLLERVVDTVEKLEIARQLAAATAPVSIHALRTTTRLDSEAFESTLRALAETEIVQRGEGELVTLGARAHSPDFEALMERYTVDFTAVISALTEISVRRIRAMAAMTFADAFVLTRGKRRGEPS